MRGTETSVTDHYTTPDHFCGSPSYQVISLEERFY